MATAYPLITAWAGADLISVKQLDAAAVTFLCDTAAVMRRIVEGAGGCKLLEHKVLANVFYEPSTRTSSSFAAAMQRLGGSVLQINETTSSVVKGETLSDTVRCLECYADAIVLRHPQQGAAAEAAAASIRPVLNAGDGVGEHPSQALLDFFTIVGELPGGVAGKTVVLVGDLKHGRTVHSLARLLAMFPVERLIYVSPPELSMPAALVEELAARGVRQESIASLEEALPLADVLYVTRVQKERFASLEEYERLKAAFVVTEALMQRLAKPAGSMIVMHPLPRVGEIAVGVDADPRAAYFKQMRYGLFMRMALLALVLGVTREAIDAAGAGK